MGSSSLSRRRLVRARVACAGTLLLIFGLFAAVGAKAQDASQDVAEAARREKARKAARTQPTSHEQPTSPEQTTSQAESTSRGETHVYTNEDLQRSHILIEEDRVRVAARKQNPAQPSPAGKASPAEKDAAVASDARNADESLGVVARRYRRLKSEREASEAAKQAVRNPSSSQFHLGVPGSSLGDVLPNVAPRVAARGVLSDVPPAVPQHGPNGALRVAPSLPIIVLPLPDAKARGKGYVIRRDPFSRSGFGLAREGFDSTHAIPVRPAVPFPTSPKNAALPSTSGRSAIVDRAKESSATVAGVTNESAVGTRMLRRVDAGASPARTTVTIRAGDSLWRLSRRYSGRGGRWPEWLRRNPSLADARSLRVGTTLVVPPREDGDPPGSASAPVARTVVVRSGDSLWKIAVDRYGEGTRWACVARANPGVRDAKAIYPGQMLKLPAACGESASHLSAIAR